MHRYSIIIPCYNESKNIPLNLERYNDVIKREDIELLIVNNGSTDNTSEVLAGLLPRYPFAREIVVKQNQGYGFGVLKGLEAAQGEFLAWTHADMQTDPTDVLKAIEIIESQADATNVFVKGRRRQRPLVDRIFTMGMSLFESLLLRQRLFDINAQPNLFHRSFYQQWESPPHDFSLDLYVYYKARKLGKRLIRFDVLFPERIYGQSHWNFGWASKWKFIKRTINFSFELKRSLRAS